MNGRPWWSAADEAEWQLLVNEIVDEAWPHRGKPGFPAALEEALNAAYDWKRRRELQSLACYLRARQDIADWKAAS